MAKSKPLSREEKLKRKRECEKRRREKIKQDDDKLKVLQAKKHEIYMNAIKTGKVKLVKDMTEREKRVARKGWKERSKVRRTRLRNEAASAAFCQNTTPPNSEEEFEQPQELAMPAGNAVKLDSSQKKRGRKLVRKDRASAYRAISKLKKENANLRRSFEKYKKKYQRVVQQEKKKNVNDLTPKSKVNRMLQGYNVDKNVKKRLLFAEALTTDLKSSFKSLKSERERQVFTKVLGGKVLRKYRVLEEAKGFLPRKLFLSNSRRLDRFSYERLTSKTKDKVKKDIENFWEDDEYSTVCPGKKDIVKKNGIKKQKRYLNDTLKNLHKVFKKKANLFVSYSLFCKLRPFWVVPPNVNTRDTCLCIKHEHFRLYTEKLKSINVIKWNTPKDVVKALTCDKEDNEQCLARKCENNTVLYQEFDYNDPVEYKIWVQKKEKRLHQKTNKEISVQVTSKDSIQCTIGQLVRKYEEVQKPFMSHVMNVKHQYIDTRFVKEQLTEKDLFLHIDFSENYQCKFAAEPQSVHFGASRHQVTIHTGVIYSKDFKEGFATLSPSLSHNAQAIIAHLRPVLSAYLSRFPHVVNLHFLSDSPNNQYRNGKMFFLMTNRLPELFPCLETITWHYSEAGHGKGAPDGIGGTLKRTADRVVAEGKDISNFDALFIVLAKSIKNIKLLKVDTCQVEEEHLWLLQNNIDLKPIKGTMQVHQITWEKVTSSTMYRSLSCTTCKGGEECKHYHIVSRGPYGMEKEGCQPKQKDEDINIGQWVIIKYDGALYPGEVMSKEAELVEVNVMHPTDADQKKFKWPSATDQHKYPYSFIVKKIEPPKPCSSRAAFFTFDGF